MPEPQHYDVIIVGAGPAGIFTAMELVGAGEKLKILLIEKGRDISRRKCPMKLNDVSCAACPECALLSGWGGAGAYSDGKLSLSPDIGGFLGRYVQREDLLALIDYVDSVYVRFGAPKNVYGSDRGKVSEIAARAAAAGLQLVPSRIRHIGTDRCPHVLKRMKTSLRGKVDIIFEAQVQRVLCRRNRVRGVKLSGGRKFTADFVVLAPGREGSKWLEAETRRLDLTVLSNPVDIGVRVELPASVMEPLTRVTYEPKLLYNTKKFDDWVRTFCVNPYGEVVKEYLKDVWTVNGHSYASHKTRNTNFALLVSTAFTEPFDEPISYGRYIAGLANFLGRGVILQRLGDLKAGRRSTPARIKAGSVRPTLKDATPGDLSFVLPYRHLTNIMEMLGALDRLVPGVDSPETLLYGVEVKFYSMRLKLSNQLETEVENLMAVGDGPGVTRGLIQASASGVLAAREILGRRG